MLSKQSRGSHTLPGEQEKFHREKTLDLGPEGCAGILQVQEAIGHAQKGMACVKTWGRACVVTESRGLLLHWAGGAQ